MLKTRWKKFDKLSGDRLKNSEYRIEDIKLRNNVKEISSLFKAAYKDMNFATIIISTCNQVKLYCEIKDIEIIECMAIKHPVKSYPNYPNHPSVVYVKQFLFRSKAEDYYFAATPLSVIEVEDDSLSEKDIEDIVKLYSQHLNSFSEVEGDSFSGKNIQGIVKLNSLHLNSFLAVYNSENPSNWYIVEFLKDRHKPLIIKASERFLIGLGAIS